MRMEGRTQGSHPTFRNPNPVGANLVFALYLHRPAEQRFFIDFIRPYRL